MIKLNAGFSRKIGEPNYGSRGASVNVDLEVESNLIDQPEQLQQRIRALFTLARKAVDDELSNGSNQNGGNGREPINTNTQSDPASASSGVVCSICGAGNLSEKVIKYSQEKLGKPTCYNCQRNNGNRGR